MVRVGTEERQHDPDTGLVLGILGEANTTKGGSRGNFFLWKNNLIRV